MSSSKAAFSNSELFVLKKKQKQRNQDPPKLLREVFNIHFSAEGWAGNFNQITIFVSFIPVSTSPLYHFITPEFVNSFFIFKAHLLFYGYEQSWSRTSKQHKAACNMQPFPRTRTKIYLSNQYLIPTVSMNSFLRFSHYQVPTDWVTQFFSI